MNKQHSFACNIIERFCTKLSGRGSGAEGWMQDIYFDFCDRRQNAKRADSEYALG